MATINKDIYKKHNSFFSFRGKDIDVAKSIYKRILNVRENKLGLSSLSINHQKLLDIVMNDLFNKEERCLSK